MLGVTFFLYESISLAKIVSFCFNRSKCIAIIIMVIWYFFPCSSDFNDNRTFCVCVCVRVSNLFHSTAGDNCYHVHFFPMACIHLMLSTFVWSVTVAV